MVTACAQDVGTVARSSQAAGAEAPHTKTLARNFRGFELDALRNDPSNTGPPMEVSRNEHEDASITAPEVRHKNLDTRCAVLASIDRHAAPAACRRSAGVAHHSTRLCIAHAPSTHAHEGSHPPAGSAACTRHQRVNTKNLGGLPSALLHRWSINHLRNGLVGAESHPLRIG